MSANQKTIYVYDDFSQEEPILLGMLYVNVIKGGETYSFEYSNGWLKQTNLSVSLDPELIPYGGRQFSNGKNIFGMFADASPDRWGRVLMNKRERIRAQKEARKPRKLYDSDYLLGVYDETRMGGIRFKLDPRGTFLSDDREKCDFYFPGIAAGGGIVAAMAAVLIYFTPYMTARINLWQDPWSFRQGDGYQTVQSLIAMGSGGLLGRGLGNSMQKMLYIPEPENDFVFPIVVEELGFVGGLVVLVLFALLILRGYWLALHARDRFGALTIVGIISLLAVQVFLNIGVVTNLIPNTGISLPFFSYGGTALMIQLAEMGMVLSISRQIPAPKND